MKDYLFLLACIAGLVVFYLIVLALAQWLRGIPL